MAKTEFDRRLFVLNEAKESLERIGVELKKRNVEVRVFLNRIAALTVAKQNLVFSLVSLYGVDFANRIQYCLSTCLNRVVHQHDGRRDIRG